MSDWVQMLTAATALVAVIVGPIVSVNVARRQIRASVVSTNRQAWINSLRDTLADFLSKHTMARNLNRLRHADEHSVSRIEEILRLNLKAEMMLNPSEKDHARLIAIITEMTNTISRSTTEAASDDANKQQADANKQQGEFIALSQAILKREWERVKRGD